MSGNCEYPKCMMGGGSCDRESEACSDAPKEQVDHPSHYGGRNSPYEVIEVIEAWELDFHLGNTVKYVARAGKKNPDKEIEDLEKAAWYLARKIKNLKFKKETGT